MELVLLVERLLSLLIVCNVFCCYSLLSEIAESGDSRVFSVCGTCSVVREFAE